MNLRVMILEHHCKKVNEALKLKSDWIKLKSDLIDKKGEKEYNRILNGIDSDILEMDKYTSDYLVKQGLKPYTKIVSGFTAKYL